MAKINLKVKHPPRIKTTRKATALNIYNSSRWQKLRRAKIRSNPICELCAKKNLTRVAREVDHIRPFEEGRDYNEVIFLAYDWDNLQSLCIPCHKEKHKGQLNR